MSNSRLIELLIDCTLRIGDRGYGGTGFFVAPGTILTCAHVIRGKGIGDNVELIWKGRNVSGSVLELHNDIDVAVLTTTFQSHPCVLLSSGWALETPLYSYGYPVRAGSVRGESIKPQIEGETHPDPDRAAPPLLKLAQTQIEPGFSGAPLLNRSTGAVCGIIKSTRDRSTDLGGRAIPWAAVSPLLPRIADENRGFHERENTWGTAVALQHLQPEMTLTRGVSGLAAQYSERIRNFITAYIGTVEEPEPFGGRSEQIHLLDWWLRTEGTPPYFLLTAPAGRGKSALLVHWCRLLLEQQVQQSSRSLPPLPGLHLVFLPISIRYQTNLASVAFAALAARLAEIHGEPLPRLVGNAADEWRGIAASYVERSCADGSTVLLVMDGLDEAADWQPGPDLFPLPPPAGLKVVVSARLTERRPLPQSWLEALGWHRSGTAQQLALVPLTKSGLADVLVQMGVPLNDLANRNDIVDELFRLSEGDPLLLSLYVKDLWKRGDAAVRIHVHDLCTIRSGLDGYFERWWEDQRELWKRHFAAKAPLQEESTRLLLKLLACALGPLRRKDLLRLAQGRLEQLTFQDAVLPLDRFIVHDGSGNGFVFAHPRLAEYHHAQLAEAGEAGAWEERFIDWGREVAEALACKSLPPEAAPTYVVQYYGTHLDRASAVASSYVQLLNPGWIRAWYEIDKTYSGLLSDVNRVWSRLETPGEPSERINTLQYELLCALIHASITSAAERVSPGLLAKLVVEGIHTVQQVRVYTDRMVTPLSRASALTAIAGAASPEERNGAYLGALTAISLVEQVSEMLPLLKAWFRNAPDELLVNAIPLLDRAGQLAEFSWLKHLLERIPDAYLNDILPLAMNSERWASAPDVSFLLALAARLNDSQMRNLISITALNLSHDDSFRFLTALAPSVRAGFLAEWYRALCVQAKHYAESFSRQEVRGANCRLKVGRVGSVLVTTDVADMAALLTTAMRELRPELLPSLLRTDLADYERTDHERSIIITLLGTNPADHSLPVVATLLCLGARGDLPDPVLPIVQEITDDRLRCDGYAIAAQSASGLDLAVIRALIDSSPTINARSRALCSLAVATQSVRDIGRAVRAIKLLPSAMESCTQFVFLAELAPDAFRRGLWRRAVASSSRVHPESDRAGLLAELATVLPTSLLDACVKAALAVRHPCLRAGTLAAVARRSPVELHSQLLQEARRTDDESSASVILAELARNLSSEELDTALAIADGFTEERWRVHAVLYVVPKLPIDMRQRGIRIGYGISDRLLRAQALAIHASTLPTDEASEIADTAARAFLRVVPHCVADWNNILVSLSPYLSEHVMAAVVEKVARLGLHLPVWTQLALEAARRLSPEKLPAVLDIIQAPSLLTPYNQLWSTIAARISPFQLSEHLRLRKPHPSRVAGIIKALNPDMLPALALDIPGFDNRLRELVLYECARRGPNWGLHLVLHLVESLEAEMGRTVVLKQLAIRYPIAPHDPIIDAATRLDDRDLGMSVLNVRIGQLPADERREAWLQAYDASQVIGDHAAAVDAIIEIANFLAADTREQESLTRLALQVSDGCRSDLTMVGCLTRIASTAPRATWNEVVARVQRLPKSTRSRPLSRLVLHISAEAARYLARFYLSRDAIMPTAAEVSEAERAVVSAVLGMSHDSDMDTAFLTVVSGDDTAMEELLLAVRECPEIALQERFLSRLISLAPPRLLHDIERAVAAMSPGSAQLKLRDQINQRRRSGRSQEAEALDQFNAELGKLLGTARDIYTQEEESAQWHAVIGLLLRDKLPKESAQVVEDFASNIPEGLLPNALRAIEGIRDPWCRTAGLAAIARRTRGGLEFAPWFEAFIASVSCGSDSEAQEFRRRILSGVLDPIRFELLTMAARGDSRIRAAAVPLLPSEWISEEFRRWIPSYAAEIAEGVRQGRSQEWFVETFQESLEWLRPLLTRVNPGELNWAIETVSLGPEPLIALIIPILHEFSPIPQRLRAISVADRLQEESWQHWAAISIAPNACGEDLPAVRRLCLKLGSTANRIEAAELLVARALAVGSYQEAADLMIAVALEDVPLNTWPQLLGRLSEGPPGVVVQAWRALVRNLSRHPRGELLKAFPEIVLAGQRAQPESEALTFCESTARVTEWWP